MIFYRKRKKAYLILMGLSPTTRYMKKRMKAKYALKPCLECNILPICMICTQKTSKDDK